MPLQSAKEKFQAAVDSTRNSEGDAKGPPLKVANPSTDDASISNKFVIPGRTAEAHSDTLDAQQKAGSQHTSFFKGNTS